MLVYFGNLKVFEGLLIGMIIFCRCDRSQGPNIGILIMVGFNGIGSPKAVHY